MRLAGMAVLCGLVLSHAAAAQNAIAVPPPPPIMAAPSTPLPPPLPAVTPPPGLVQTPLPPSNSDTGTGSDGGATNGTATATPGAAPAPPPPSTWIPAKTATIGVLNKVDGDVANLTIPVGGQAASGDLQLSVTACLVRPPDQVPDAAVFLSVTPAANAGNPGSAIFTGWLLRSAPGAAVAGNGSETFRVVNCS